MLTNAFKLIKHNFLKYFFLGILIFILILAGLILRISYKPLDINFITKYVKKEKINKILPLESLENAEIHLNLLENTVSINIKNLKNYKFPIDTNEFNISLPFTKEINVGLTATALIKKKLEFRYIKLNDAQVYFSLNKNIFEYNIKKDIKTLESFLLPKKIELLNSELSIFLPKDLGFVVAKKIDFDGTYEKGTIKVNKIKTEKIEFFEKNKQLSFEVTKPVLSFKNSILEGKAQEIKLFKIDHDNEIQKILKKFNITYNDFKFTNTNIKYDIRDQFFINSKIFYKEELVPVKINGSFTEDFSINANLNFEFSRLSLPKNSTKQELFDGFIINNLDKFTLQGKVKIQIFNSKFLASSFEIKSDINNKNSSALSINEYNYPLYDFSIKADIIESQLEINRLLINNSKDKIEIKGKINDIYEDPEAKFDINIKKLSLLSLNNILFANIDKFAVSPYMISKFVNGNIENINLSFLYNKETTEIKKINGKFINIKAILKNNIIVAIDDGIIGLEKKNEVVLKAKRVFLTKEDKKILLSKNVIEFKNLFNQDSYSFLYQSNIKTELKSLLNFYYVINESSLENFRTYDVSGSIDATIMLNNSFSNNDNFNYGLYGKINNFNLVNNNDYPITLENFNGDIELKDNLLVAKGKAFLNKSESNIDIKLNQNYQLFVNVDSVASFSSFDFLEEYNFLKSGTSKLNIKIEKNYLFDDEWEAFLQANLYNNSVKIDQVVYEKEEKKQGWFEATYKFKNLSLENVENLTFLTEDILIRGDVFLDKTGVVNKIEVKEFKRELDDFSANIDFEANDFFLLDVIGKSVNINNFFSENSSQTLSGKLNILVKNLHFNNFNFGNTKISSEIYNNKMVNLNGEIYHKEKKYSYFDYMLNKKSSSSLKLTFLDFGLFLKNIDVSDKFISGNGDIIFKLDNQSNNIISGKYLIKDFNIKDASFLARLLQLASFTGLLEILASEGIPFTNLQGEFKIDESLIKIKDTRFEGLSLGASTSGSINLMTKDLDLEGVLIPAYAINAILNKIPLLGKIITGVEGEGIIGFNYKVNGNYENPEYSINPFSVLTPGIIRSIFKGFSDDNKEQKKEDSSSN